MRKILILIICFIILSGSQCFAELEKTHSFEIGTEVLHVKNEYGSSVEQWKGNMYGLTGSYTYRSPDDFILKGEGRAVYGEVDFSSNSIGSLDGIEDYILEGRILTGKEFSIGLSSVVTPYIGLGERYLNDDMDRAVTSSGVMAFKRKETYIYLPVGIEVINDLTSLDKGWLIGGKIEYDFLLNGKDEGSNATVDLANSDDDGSYRLSLKAIRKFEALDLVIEPFLRHWDIKKAKSFTDSSTGVLRKMETTEIGMKLMVRF